MTSDKIGGKKHRKTGRDIWFLNRWLLVTEMETWDSRDSNKRITVRIVQKVEFERNGVEAFLIIYKWLTINSTFQSHNSVISSCQTSCLDKIQMAQFLANLFAFPATANVHLFYLLTPSTKTTMNVPKSSSLRRRRKRSKSSATTEKIFAAT